jgi:RNA polymerase sigma factor (sigma-70 family)
MATRLMTAQPDAVLCRLAARGNVGAYDALYQRYRQPIFAFVFHLLGRADGNEDAEDIAQDTFTRAFAGIREQRIDGSFRGWIYTIARNRTYDMIRTRKQKVVSLDAEAAEPPIAPVAEQPAELAEQRAEFAWMMAAVADLPERQREALLLREMGGFSHERIADELGTTVSATKKLISRGRDGIGEAAVSVGYGRISRRKLGHDLAMAAPVIPISLTLASLGITAGAGTVAGGAAATGAFAGGGAIAGGKVAATALTVLAIGGGAVAVEHNNEASQTQKPAAAQRSITQNSLTGPGSAESNNGRGLPQGVKHEQSDRHGGSGSGGSADDSNSSGRRGEAEPGDDHRGRSGGGDDDVAVRGGDGDRSGKTPSGGRSGDDGGSESGSGKNSGPSSGSGSESSNSGPPPPAPAGSESGSNSGPGSSGSGKDAERPSDDSSGESSGSGG